MPARSALSTVERGYGGRHQATRAELAPLVASGGVRCWRCHELIEPSEAWDLGHVDGDRGRYAGPEHVACNRATAGRRPWMPPAEVEVVEVEGIAADDERWAVPWLRELQRVPQDATWPRLMTVPHPRAVGSLGPQFIAWAQQRSNMRLRWWQRLTATRLLEVDADEQLVWETLVLTMARQLGKSWLLRELLIWRIHQGERFGEPQDALHTGKDLAVCKEVQRPARLWAKQRSAYRVREVNGQEEIELLADGSRWMLRAKEAVYGYSVSLGAVDEAWKVRESSVEEGMTPTMAERAQPQLLLVSTAHRLATSLMLSRRQAALGQLEAAGGDLLIEWSAPRAAVIGDRDAWRAASPHWTSQRERLISRRLEAIQAGETVDPDEPDPEESFRSQWLNQWPAHKVEPTGAVQDLLRPGLWRSLSASEPLRGSQAVYVAVEDDFGLGAAVAAVSALDDGRLEVDGWLVDDWDSAVLDVERLALVRQIRELHVGASLLDRMPPRAGLPQPRPAVAAGARHGLALLRDLASAGRIIHDDTTRELDSAIVVAKVRETTTGLYLLPSGPVHLLKALAWALLAAHKPSQIAAVY